MSAFRDKFTTDPVHTNWHHLETAKPVFRNAAVRFTPPFANETNVSGTVQVSAMFEIGGELGDHHELAWEFVTANAVKVEAALRRKLFVHHMKGLELFELELLRDYDDDEIEAWQTTCQGHDLRDPTAVDKLYELTSVGLLDHGLDHCGFSYFNFNCGWDEEHGVSVLMHRNSLLALGGSSEFAGRGSSLISHVRYIQSRQLDDEDLSLLDR